VRELFYSAGFKSAAAPGFESPSVVVLHTDDINLHNTSLFREQGLQTAAGVPLMCGEPEGFRTFRIGLFGLEQLNNVDRTVENLRVALEAIQG
jgi:aspartate aminotransferase-like enzyme